VAEYLACGTLFACRQGVNLVEEPRHASELSRPDKLTDRVDAQGYIVGEPFWAGRERDN
jgi:hypothetical protein